MPEQSRHIDGPVGASKGLRPAGHKQIPRRHLVVDRFDLRLAIEPLTDLARLADSITNDGQAQPLIALDIGGGRYEVVAGTRRARAVPDHTVLDVLVLPADTPESVLWRLALAENRHRRDLSFCERTIALAYTFDAMACSRSPLYLQLGATREQRLRAYRNRLLNQAKADRKATNDQELDKQVNAVFEELTATHTKPLSAKTFFPRHLRVLDLPPEILADVAGLSQNDLLQLLTALEARDDESCRQLVAEIKLRAQNGELTSTYIGSLVNQANRKTRPKKGFTLRFDSYTPIDEQSGLYRAKGREFLVLELSDDAAKDRKSALSALKQAHAQMTSASASGKRSSATRAITVKSVCVQE